MSACFRDGVRGGASSIPCHLQLLLRPVHTPTPPSLCLTSVRMGATPHWYIGRAISEWSSYYYCSDPASPLTFWFPSGVEDRSWGSDSKRSLSWILEPTLEIKSFPTPVVHLLLEKLHDSDIPELLKEAWDKRSRQSRNYEKWQLGVVVPIMTATQPS